MKQKLLLLLSTLIICFLLLETSLFFLVHKDLDQNLILNNLHLRPFKLPVKETKAKIDKILSTNYNNNYQNVRLVPDSELGWSPNPNYESNNNIYKYNSDGIRTSDANKNYVSGKKLRIAIFGDSYSHGDEVYFNNTIGNYLEEFFLEEKLEVEVLNFAVSGYGMDQAFLRYQAINKKFKPDIVLLGVQFENVKRHVNILRPFYFHTTEIPYSKPRFLLNGDKLSLVNNPIADISKTIEIIKDFENWQFVENEGFYSNDDYKESIFNYSKSYSLFTSLADKLYNEFHYFNLTSESYRITKGIFKLFVKNCEDNNQIFIPVHLPTINDLSFIQKTFFNIIFSEKYIYQELFSELKREVQFVETFNKLEEWSSENDVDQLFMKRHYSPAGNKIIAEKIYSFIKSQNYNFIKD